MSALYLCQVCRNPFPRDQVDQLLSAHGAAVGGGFVCRKPECQREGHGYTAHKQAEKQAKPSVCYVVKSFDGAFELHPPPGELEPLVSAEKAAGSLRTSPFHMGEEEFPRAPRKPGLSLHTSPFHVAEAEAWG